MLENHEFDSPEKLSNFVKKKTSQKFLKKLSLPEAWTPDPPKFLRKKAVSSLFQSTIFKGHTLTG